MFKKVFHSLVVSSQGGVSLRWDESLGAVFALMSRLVVTAAAVALFSGAEV